MLAKRWSAIALLASVLLSFCPSVGNPAENKAAKPAPLAPAVPQEQCATLRAKELTESARAAATPTEPTKVLRVLPGGAAAKIEIPVVAPANSVYCARFLDRDRPLRVLTAIPGTAEKAGSTTVALEVQIGRASCR